MKVEVVTSVYIDEIISRIEGSTSFCFNLDLYVLPFSSLV